MRARGRSRWRAACTHDCDGTQQHDGTVLQPGRRVRGGTDARDETAAVLAETSFHHFADYNWDPDRGAPSFVTGPPGDGVKREPHKLEDIKAYVGNLARWLAPKHRR